MRSILVWVVLVKQLHILTPTETRHLATQRRNHAPVAAHFLQDWKFSIGIGKPLLFYGRTGRGQASDDFVVTAAIGSE